MKYLGGGAHNDPSKGGLSGDRKTGDARRFMGFFIRCFDLKGPLGDEGLPLRIAFPGLFWPDSI